MQDLIPSYGLAETNKFRQNMSADDIFSLGHFFWVLDNSSYPNERLRVEHWVMIMFCASTTARGGTVVESSCYFGRNEAVEYGDVHLFAMRDPENPSEGIKLGMHVQLRLLKGKRNRGNPYVFPIHPSG